MEECPKCGKFSYDIDLLTHIGKCRNCGFHETIDKSIWNLKYDDVCKGLRAALKSSSLRREHIIEYFKLESADSPFAAYLLTSDVLEELEKQVPEIYNRLPKANNEAKK